MIETQLGLHELIKLPPGQLQGICVLDTTMWHINDCSVMMIIENKTKLSLLNDVCSLLLALLDLIESAIYLHSIVAAEQEYIYIYLKGIR